MERLSGSFVHHPFNLLSYVSGSRRWKMINCIPNLCTEEPWSQSRNSTLFSLTILWNNVHLCKIFKVYLQSILVTIITVIVVKIFNSIWKRSTFSSWFIHYIQGGCGVPSPFGENVSVFIILFKVKGSKVHTSDFLFTFLWTRLFSRINRK